MQVIWAVVANRAGARIFERRDRAAGYSLKLSLECPEALLANSDFTSDSPGVSLTTPGGPRHTFGPHHTPQELVADDFAREVAELLEQSVNSAKFTDLYLFAEPHFLGQLRGHLRHNSKKHLIDSIGKDFAASSGHELKHILEQSCV